MNFVLFNDRTSKEEEPTLASNLTTDNADVSELIYRSIFYNCNLQAYKCSLNGSPIKVKSLKRDVSEIFLSVKIREDKKFQHKTNKQVNNWANKSTNKQTKPKQSSPLFPQTMGHLGPGTSGS